ncbi:hypothetical protein [Bradyrhizobium canariense]|uniref:Phospholipase D-like domain-containing protein n=1 Tax=Bradyrhizobium canariense TaxID=255045 RepID=A0A1H1ZLA2_9BRAD|nr:hypothetical protein [Bradyrhizobium canariense]SDT34433.1 hypothetical protein SAMN05444158_5520 [Bradyrhizobium canariense]
MPSRRQILEVLQELVLRMEAEGLDFDLEIETIPLFFDRELVRILSKIEDKVDQLLGRHEYGRCRFAGAEGENVVELITGIGPTARADALVNLGACLAGTPHLIICDPYFLFLSGTRSSDDYVDAVDSVLPTTLKSLEIFSGKRKRTPAVANGLNQLFKRRNIRVKSYKTDDIHDRVWIKDSQNAYSVGTSFNGLGNKCAFILPLPSADLRAFWTEINTLRIELATSKSV